MSILDQAQQALNDGRKDDVWALVRADPNNAPAWRLLAAVTEATIIVGAFLPWYWLRIGMLDFEATIGGMGGIDGKLTLVGGMLVFLAGFGMRNQVSAKVRVFGALVAGAVGANTFYIMQQVRNNEVGEFMNATGFNQLGGGMDLSVRMGIYVVLGGAIMALLGAGLPNRRQF